MRRHGAFDSPWCSLCSLFSCLSTASIISLGSLLSVASVGSVLSVLSIGSYQSILSIGCTNRFLTVCNWHEYTVRPLPPTGGGVLIEGVDTTACGDGKAAVRTSTPRSAAGYEVCSVDEATPLTCPDGAASLTGPETCMGIERVEKDQTLVVRRTGDGAVQSIAHMPPRYTYNRTANYARNYAALQTATIVIPDAEAWRKLSSCTYAQKQADKPVCDWVAAKCTFDDRGAHECRVKRKGNGSWRGVHDKPSLKVKWKSSDSQYKLTFNNNVQEKTPRAQIRAYDVFRELGVVTPRANSVMLRFGPSEQAVNAYQEYTQVEEIDEVEFLGARGLDGASVYEFEWGDRFQLDQTAVDIGPRTHKLGPEDSKDASLLELQQAFAGELDIGAMWRVINQTQLFKWYGGLVATGHSDSGCMSTSFNNMYTMLPYLQRRYVFVPWGTDKTMHCNAALWLMPTTFATCGPMKACFANTQCSEEYFAATVGNRKLCGTERGYMLMNAVLLLLLASAYAAVLRCNTVERVQVAVDPHFLRL